MSTHELFSENHLIALLIFTVATFGMCCNWFIVFFINRVSTLQNAFGKLTTSQATAEAVHLTIFTFFYAPMVFFDVQSMKDISHRFGHILLICYDICIYCHLLISLNRMTAIMLPLQYDRIFSENNTKKMIIAAWFLSITPTIYYYVIADCSFYFSEDYWHFVFSTSPICIKIAWYTDFLKYVTIVVMIVLIDLFTLLRVHAFNRLLISNNSSSSRVRRSRRAEELNFLKQACLQAMVFVCELLTYFVLYEYFKNKYVKFLLTTFAWVCVHSTDGLITVYFNREFHNIWKNYFDSSTISMKTMGLSSRISPQIIQSVDKNVISDMNFHVIGYLSIFLSTVFILFQLIFLPVVLQRINIKNNNVLKTLDSIKISDRYLSSSFLSIERSKRSIQCLPGLPGPQGPEGADGEAGSDGEFGERGLDARDILENEEQKCFVCPAGPTGPIGPPGDRGVPGSPGEKGLAGMPASDGVDGEIGIEGDTGPSGFPGPNGEPGSPGKGAMGGTGLPGPKGAPGPVGRAGLQGPRGKRNYIYGQAGPLGQNGPNGLDGIPGKQGERGYKGTQGERGANAKFCPCPLELQLLSEKKHNKPGVANPTTTGPVAPVESQVEMTAEALPEASIGPIRSPGFRTSSEGAPPGSDALIIPTSTTSTSTPSTTTTTEGKDVIVENPVVVEEFNDEPPEIIETADSPRPFGHETQQDFTDEYEDEPVEITTTKRRFIYVTKKPLFWD